MAFEVTEHLVLQLELLGHGLEHELDVPEGVAQVIGVADGAALDARRLELIEHLLRQSDSRLGSLERLLAHVVQRDRDAGAREHGPHARAHRAGADHGRASHRAVSG